MKHDGLLRELLGTEPLKPLIGRLARKLGRDRSIHGIVTIPGASATTREAIGALLGKPPQTSPKVRVRLADLEQIVVQSGAAESLVVAVTRLVGHPLRNPAAEDRAKQQQWRNLYRCVPSWADVEIEIEEWIQQACQKGIFRRAAKADLAVGQQIMRELVQCVSRLPQSEPIPLPVFADRVLGDPHALDPDRPLSRLLYRAAARMSELAATDSVDSKRKVWTRVGIVLDELSSTALVLNLPANGDGPVDILLRSHAAVGLPCRLTFRQLRLAMPTFAVSNSETISICENPSILAAAADSLGPQCRPLICVEGQPSHAAGMLLKQLVARGAALRYHGDFDAAGIRIAVQIIQTYCAEPWRMSASDYLHAVSGRSQSMGHGLPATPWDPQLELAMRENREAVMEESVLAHLLADLAG